MLFGKNKFEMVLNNPFDFKDQKFHLGYIFCKGRLLVLILYKVEIKLLHIVTGSDFVED